MPGLERNGLLQSLAGRAGSWTYRGWIFEPSVNRLRTFPSILNASARLLLWVSFGTSSGLSGGLALSADPPVGRDGALLPLPTAAQARWQDLEFGLLFHFGLATLNAPRGSDGTLDPKIFGPTGFDAEQMDGAAVDAGARYVIVTAKHRDGFCLWPTRTTDYSVAASPWRDGNGDLLAEVSAACQRSGIGFGVYLSSWDAHEVSYADPSGYTNLFARQLEELLTGYGPLVEVWLDGASPDDRTYDWAQVNDLMARHQPEAMTFNMGAATVRWAGNDVGVAPEPCWNVVRAEDVERFSKGDAQSDGSGTVWLPVETQALLRSGWFWEPSDPHGPRSLADLMTMYYRSVGRGANFLLNVSPDPAGRIPEEDVARLRAFGSEVRRRFELPVAVWEPKPEDAVADDGTAADGGTSEGGRNSFELDLAGSKTIDHVVVAEDLRRGERVREYVVEARDAGPWSSVAAGMALGHKKVHWFEPVRARRLRLRVLESAAKPVLRQFAAYHVTAGRAAELYAKAKESLPKRDWDAAVKNLSLAIAEAPAFGPYHLLRGLVRQESKDLPGALSDLTRVLDLEPLLLELLHTRAELQFRLERFPQAIEDYGASIRGRRPHDEASCWERGLAYYYAGEFERGEEQFARYNDVGPRDIENGLWRFLCIAERRGLEHAVESMLSYPDRVRPPFPELLDLYLGRGSIEAVLAAAVADRPTRQERNQRIFYAHYYIGKYLEITGKPVPAAEQVAEALKYPIAHFMYACAEIDARRLEAKSKAK